ncbi:MAG: hypothetical protein H3C47_11835 [Candidatus Cloacimonetes bacterium]|nr:hypothetical protein [Candidatus Cloacimonadota bacterium]
MLKLKFLVLPLIFLGRLLAESTPDYDHLLFQSESESIRTSQPTPSEFEALAQPYQELEELFTGVFLFSQPGVAEIFPQAGSELLKIVGAKATAFLSALPPSDHKSIGQLRSKIQKLVSVQEKPENLHSVLFSIKSLMFGLSEELKQNLPHSAQAVLDESRLQAALILLEDLNHPDSGVQGAGIQKMFSDLGKLLNMDSHPLGSVWQKAVTELQNVSVGSTFARQKLLQFTQEVFYERDGRDPWHPPVSAPQFTSKSQKYEFIQVALQSSLGYQAPMNRPGFFRRVATGAANLFIPQAHAQTQVSPGSPRQAGSSASVSEVRRKLIRLPDGSEFRGDLVGNRPHGRGWLKRLDKTSYFGDWVDGKPEGYGVIYLAKGQMYQGQMIQGSPQGEGSFRFVDDTIYRGTVHQGLPNGNGTILLPNGIVIEGEFFEGVLDGLATIRDGFGNVLELSFDDGEPVGDASFLDSEGFSLAGFFENSFDSFELFSIADRYDNYAEIPESGFLPDDLEEPKDLATEPGYESIRKVITVARSDVYETAFNCEWNGEVRLFRSSDYPHGYGSLTCPDGLKYQGMMVSSVHETNGILSKADGYGRLVLPESARTQYREVEGFFNDGQIVGQAQILFRSGLAFQGRVDTRKVTLNPPSDHWRSPASLDGNYIGSENNPLGVEGELYLGPVRNSHPYGAGFLKRFWYSSSLALTERCQYSDYPFRPSAGYPGYRRAGYCEIEKPHNAIFKGYLYGGTYSAPAMFHPGPYGRGADFKDGNKWREGWYADGPQFMGQEKPADYDEDFSYIPDDFRKISDEETITQSLIQVFETIGWVGAFEMATDFFGPVKTQKILSSFWNIHHLSQELLQASNTDDENKIREKIATALVEAALGEALVTIGSKAYKNGKKFLSKSPPKQGKIKRPSQLGREGEEFVRKRYDIGEPKKITVNNRDRIPDGIQGKVISEVKNVRRLSFTRQLRDYLDYAEAEGMTLRLYVRKDDGTKLSKQLKALRDSGRIEIFEVIE